jgi:hypothetical protein
MGTSKITNLGTPTSGTDASTKQYVDDTLNYGIAASTSASAANISAMSAAGSSASASQSAATVTSLYDSFDDRYLGAKSSVPNSDNDGDALLVGALYFDTTSNAMKVYTGTGGWVETGSTVNGILDKFRYVSTASQTTFSGSDANGNTLAYDPSAVDVYLSGLRLVSGTDYTATSGTSIQLTTAPDTGSTLEIVAFGNVVVNDPQQITASQLDLKAIAETKSDTAVDVFVYDTSKDSDGGAWRHRTQGTSWYNEALNTSTRGATKKFPAVAVIVAEPTKVTIYDGDDPAMPMWMVFNGFSGASAFHLGGYSNTGTFTGVTALNGTVLTSSDGGLYEYRTGLGEANLIKDSLFLRRGSAVVYTFINSIIDRNLTTSPQIIIDTTSLVSGYANDVAMTVLPNAPIDADTGLPVPTIAVATEGGASLIKDDGSVVSLTTGGTGVLTVDDIAFSKDNSYILVAYGDNTARPVYAYPINLESWSISNPDVAQFGHDGGRDAYILNEDGNSLILEALPDTFASGSIAGLSKFNVVDDGTISQSTGEELSAHITSSYNTGWMPGDIKLATLMDTTAGTIVAPELVTNGGFAPSDGVELVTNGTFNTDVAGWTPLVGSSTIVRTDGTNYPSLPVGCAYINTNSSGTGAHQTFTTVVGRTYTVSVDLVYSSISGSTPIARVFIGNQTGYAGGISIYDIASTGTHIFTFTAQETTTKIGLRGRGTSSSQVVYDNVSVKEDSLASNWTIGGTGATAGANVSDQLELTRNGSSATAFQLVTGLVYGDDYLVSLDLVGATGGADVRVDFDGVSSETTSTAGNVSFKITASNVQSLFEFNVMNTTSGTITVDNASVKRVVADRSVNNNGLNLVGNVTKSAVATGAELVGYSGWADNNHVLQSPNSDLEFGTGDFCVMAWVKMTADSTSNGRILHIENTDGTNEYSLGFDSYYLSGTTGVRIYTFGADTNPLWVTSTDAINSGNWTHVVGLRRNSIIHLYVNGKHSGSALCADQIGGSGDDYHASVGVDASSQGAVFDGSLALVRASATAPTEEQIAKIYRDEKPLFQENAKATLYGTLDANIDQTFGHADTVTALAYDEDTDLLHAGTSRGRSVFKGLQRIDNTTDAVGSAISAVNGLVAED